jgi:hypothetical protein
MADKKNSPGPNQRFIGINSKKSPLHGISTDEHDLSTGHGGSKFDNSLMENGLRGNNLNQDSLMDAGGS